MDMDADEANTSFGVCTPEGGELLAMGSAGAVFTFPDRPNVVCKMPFRPVVPSAHEGNLPADDVEDEKRIYKRLGKHPNIIGCLEITEESIHLERATPGCLRLYFKDGGSATLEERLRWSRDLASVIQYLHDHNVRQVDIGGRNILLDADRNIRLCDFAGSVIDDVKPTIVAQNGFRHPDEKEAWGGTLRAEIHALGSTIFEIMTSTGPYRREEQETEGSALDLMRRGVYPDVTDVVLGKVIAACWRGEYGSAQQVADSIAEEQQQMRDKP